MSKTAWILAAALLMLVPVGGIGADVFDHQVHLEDAEMDCTECHSLAGGGLPRRAALPGPGVCLDCHDEDENVLVTLPERPSSHWGDFLHGHQYNVRGGDMDCALCHRESEECSMCHHGENVDFLAHDRNWFYTHAMTALKGSEDCASCHDLRSYCTDCHASFGIQPSDHYSAEWVSGSGGRHAMEGRADLGSCILCHEGLPPSLCGGCHPGMGE